MSKYTEAEEHLICFLTECSMWCKENHLTETFSRAVEALQVADRLEHCHFMWHQEDFYNYEESEYGDGYEDGYKFGYNQALADIRGDAE